MEAQLKMLNGKILLKVQGITAAELFAQIAEAQSVFDAESKCGMCGGTDLKLSHRQPKGFDYFEIECCNQECRARFQFGQLKDEKGALFPKRRDADGNAIGNGGWTIYRGEGRDGSNDHNAQYNAPPARQAPPAQGRPAQAPARQASNPGPPPFAEDRDRW